MLELADRHDLGSCAERREGSSPSFPTGKIITNKDVTLKIETQEIEKGQEGRPYGQESFFTPHDFGGIKQLYR